MSWRDTTRTLLGIALAAGALMGGVAAASALRGIPVRLLMGDPAAIMDGPFYLGAVTMLRTAFLAGAAAVCLVTAQAIRARDPELGSFLRALGLLSTYLVVDDQFQIHEAVLAQIIGVPELVTFLVYAAVGLAGAVRYGRLILGLPEGGVLLCAFPCFGLAVVADQVDLPLSTSYVETTAEVLGILCLAVFGLRLSLAALHGLLGVRSASGSGPR